MSLTRFTTATLLLTALASPAFAQIADAPAILERLGADPTARSNAGAGCMRAPVLQDFMQERMDRIETRYRNMASAQLAGYEAAAREISACYDMQNGDISNYVVAVGMMLVHAAEKDFALTSTKLHPSNTLVTDARTL